MDILPSMSRETCRALSLGAVTCEVDNSTPCKTNSVTRDALCHTPTLLQLATPSPAAADSPPAEGEMLPPSLPAETVSKPPLIPLRELNNEPENGPRKMEQNSKLVPPVVKGVAILKEMPFKERNREEGKRMIPPHIKVPPKKLFGIPERYKSPTDAMMSPISKGLLARNRRPARTLAPVVPPKALENTFQDAVVMDALAGKLE